MEVNNMESYADMKDTELVWLGDIPYEWELSTISTLYNLRNEKDRLVFQSVFRLFIIHCS